MRPLTGFSPIRAVRADAAPSAWIFSAMPPRGLVEIHAAVHEIGLAGNEARVLAREVDHQRHHFLRLAEAADRLRRAQRFFFLECVALDIDGSGPNAVRGD